MFTHLLVPTDGSKLSDKAVAHAIALAKKLEAKITVFYAAMDYPTPIMADGMMYEPMPRREYTRMAAEEAAKILGKVETKAAAAGVPCTGVHTISSVPWEAILAAAKKYKCDTIVMASHGRRGVSALLLGSEAQKVLTHSKLPVLIVR